MVNATYIIKGVKFMKKQQLIQFLILFSLTLVILTNIGTALAEDNNNAITNVLCEIRLSQMVEFFERPDTSFSPIDEGIIPNTPGSLNPVSFCLGSACGGSICLGSGCGVSYCFGSACGSSLCGGSGCAVSNCGGSVCGASVCVGSVCGISACAGSICASGCK